MFLGARAEPLSSTRSTEWGLQEDIRDSCGARERGCVPTNCLQKQVASQIGSQAAPGQLLPYNSSDQHKGGVANEPIVEIKWKYKQCSVQEKARKEGEGDLRRNETSGKQIR